MAGLPRRAPYVSIWRRQKVPDGPVESIFLEATAVQATPLNFDELAEQEAVGHSKNPFEVKQGVSIGTCYRDSTDGSALALVSTQSCSDAAVFRQG